MANSHTVCVHRRKNNLIYSHITPNQSPLPSFPFEGTVHECFTYGNKLRIEHAIYNEERNVWFLNDGMGTWQGFICQ